MSGRGIGTDVLRVLADHAVAQGYDMAGASVDDEESRLFAERFEFLLIKGRRRWCAARSGGMTGAVLVATSPKGYSKDARSGGS